MSKFIFGFIVGSLIGCSVAVAALPDGIMAREFNKFVADSSGNTAVRIVFTN